jgi:chaperonin GroES
MKLKPLHTNVIIEPNAVETKTAMGIIIPDNAQEKVTRGKVLAVGPGVVEGSLLKVAMQVSVGDEVIYRKYVGTELEHDGKKLLLLEESDILTVVSP